MVVRIKDIARDLGVSSMTVSKALRNQFDISEETRKRVIKRAEELGYRPNLVARGLVTRRTYMIGMVIPDLMNSFFAEVIKGAAKRIKSHGYHVVILDSEEDANSEMGQIETLLAHNVDGLIVASAQSDGRWLHRTLGKNKIPCVLIDRTLAGLKAHYVGVDDVEIGAIATWHLIEQGCRRIAHIRGPAISKRQWPGARLPPGSGRAWPGNIARLRRRRATPRHHGARSHGATTGPQLASRWRFLLQRPGGIRRHHGDRGGRV